jgi:hypothetical protein
MPSPSSASGRAGAGLASAAVAGGVTAAVESIIEVGPEGLGRTEPLAQRLTRILMRFNHSNAGIVDA